MSDRHDQYAFEVETILRAELPKCDLAAGPVVLKCVAAHHRSGDRWNGFEVIVDSPFSANWRLKSSNVSGRVRLSDYSMNQSPERLRLTDHINRMLDAIK